MAAKKKKKRPASRKKTGRKRLAKRVAKRVVKRAKKRTTRRAPKRAPKRKKKRPVRRKTGSAKRKVGRKVRRKVGRKAKRKTARKKTRKPARKTARKRPKTAARRKKKPARRRTSARSRPARKKARAAKRKPARRKTAVRKSRKPARRFPKAPAAAARKRTPGFSLRKLAARLSPGIKPPIEAYSGNKPYIFASYSHKNIKEVFWCIKKLAESRYRIWYDEGIEPGNEWPEEVGRALTGCQLFLVFMSPAAMDSRNVRNEINFASSANKSMMVVMLQPAGLSEGMQLQIGTVQFVSKHEMTDAEFLEKMKKVLDPSLRV